MQKLATRSENVRLWRIVHVVAIYTRLWVSVTAVCLWDAATVHAESTLKAGAYDSPVDGGTALSASAALGVGTLGVRPFAVLDVGVDVTKDGFSLGLGGRVRWLVGGEGIGKEEWDSVSEYASLLRYASYRRHESEHIPGIACVIGALGDVWLGQGAVVAGYTTGLRIDRKRLGAQLVTDGTTMDLDIAIDDVVEPDMVTIHGAWEQRDGRALTTAVAVDVSAPDRMLSATATRAIPIVALGAQLQTEWSLTGGGKGQVVGHMTAVGIADADHAAGMHVGVLGMLTSPRMRAEFVAAVQLGTARYVAGYMGALYEIERADLVASRRMGQLAGLSAAARGMVSVVRLGTVAAVYQQRAGLPDFATVRVRLPHFRTVQFGSWAATHTSGIEPLRAAAAELRLQLSPTVFSLMEIVRLYESDKDAALVPVWMATVAVGGSL